ncbi:response regulator transcription factor [Silanimonas lenta]|jgi:DNA-binding response OmpR family regulator|uniref:response regulator transcription factor n=1 Tax=Silanimonas lenta TaxID=265429 RepID=UPI0003FC552F|nr:response regulator transcription factor [Silanimonas lenta]
MRLLVVEDEARVADFLQRGLRAEGYAPTVVGSAEEALPLLRGGGFELALLDVMLPGQSGLALCQQVRAECNPVRVLMLTAMGTVQDRVAGLRCGADDYLAKPFAFDELLARIEALLRRPALLAPREEQLVVGELVFDRVRMEVRLRGEGLPMTPKELALLELLMSSPGRMFSRERILSNVWGLDADPLTNVVDVYVRRLRGKLDLPGRPSWITTVRGLGYRLDPPDPAA